MKSDTGCGRKNKQDSQPELLEQEKRYVCRNCVDN